MFPHGNESLPFVEIGNKIAYRVAILIMVGLVRQVTWMLENPGNSRCIYLPCLEKLLTFKLLKSSLCKWWGHTVGVMCLYDVDPVIFTYIYI